MTANEPASRLPTRVAFPRDIQALLRMQGMMNASHFMTVPLLALHMSVTLHFNFAALATVMAGNLLSAQMLPADCWARRAV
ncbi:hypothetical protein [Paraburkholderia sp. BR10954]|uniref:hypothetical protein n=1 Tax=Paraburkholderia TaxID=1822464 RepID=UPI0034D162A2